MYGFINTVFLYCKFLGVGIPPDLLKTVFEAFSGVNQTSTRAFDGLGLGLGISHVSRV